MILIIAHHMAVHSDFVITAETNIWNKSLIFLLYPVGKLGVDLYIMISGFFQIASERCDYRHLVKLWLKVLFYSVLVGIIYIGLNYNDLGAVLNLQLLEKILLPIGSRDWWFISDYFVLMLLAPFLNQAFRTIEKRKYALF